jgi:predicted protein tyrosine phosphatase
MMIHVCPLSRLGETLASSNASHLVTLLKAETPFERPFGLAPQNHLFLSMHDIVEEQPDMVAPSGGHVEELLAFARSWDRARPMVVHCYAGISRSTAAAYIIAAALAPQRDEAELARTLRRLSPSATPNQRLIALADGLLGRGGRMIAAVAAIGRGAEAYEGIPFALPIGRGAA